MAESWDKWNGYLNGSIVTSGESIIDRWNIGAESTWRDVEELALHDPTIRQAVVLAQRGDFTRHEALIRLVVGLSVARQKQFQAAIDAMNIAPRAPWIATADMGKVPDGR
jgi:hypothetical protein